MNLFVKTAAAGVLLVSTLVHAYEVIDTGVPGRNEVYWVDNERVLFPGFQRTAQPGSSFRSVLYVWDIGTKRASVRSEIAEGADVCFASGYVSYFVDKNGKRLIREGALGAEKERELDPPALRDRMDRNQVTCRNADLVDLEKIYPGFYFIPLREGDGYYGWKKLESVVEANKSPLYYLHAGKGKKPFALPLAAGEKDRVSYSEYLGAYVIEYTPSVRDRQTTGKVWFLYTNGKVSEQTIPAGPWLRGSVGYTPAKPGIVLSSPALGRRSESDVGAAGVYLVQGTKVERLIAGFPSRYVAVSPDGCKAAAVVQLEKPTEVKATLRVVDMCK